MFPEAPNIPISKDNEVVLAGIEDDEVIFTEESPALEEATTESWKILLVDDEQEIHHVTQLALDDLIFEGKKLTFLSAYSGEEAKALIKQHSDTAMIFLDVVMETEDAGLDVVRYIREVLKNQFVQIILRTGQPGQVPEDVVTLNYDINDYKTKTELTRQKLMTRVITSLRVYKTLVENDQELEQAKQAADLPQTFRMQLINSILDSGQITFKERNWFVAATLWNNPLSAEEQAGVRKIYERIQRGEVRIID
ncbi:MAG: response regulator [Prochloraceae cyanobacterium]